MSYMQFIKIVNRFDSYKTVKVSNHLFNRHQWRFIMKVFYFTATGNSLDVAKRFGGELYSIPKVLKGNEFDFEDEKIGIVFPCYAFAAPGIVREFIEKVTLKSPYIFAIMTYGNSLGGCC